MYITLVMRHHVAIYSSHYISNLLLCFCRAKMLRNNTPPQAIKLFNFLLRHNAEEPNNNIGYIRLTTIASAAIILLAIYSPRQLIIIIYYHIRTVIYVAYKNVYGAQYQCKRCPTIDIVPHSLSAASTLEQTTRETASPKTAVFISLDFISMPRTLRHSCATILLQGHQRAHEQGYTNYSVCGCVRQSVCYHSSANIVPFDTQFAVRGGL